MSRISSNKHPSRQDMLLEGGNLPFGRNASRTEGERIIDLLLNKQAFISRKSGKVLDENYLIRLISSAAPKNDIATEIEGATIMARELRQRAAGNQVDLQTPLQVAVFLIRETARQGEPFSFPEVEKTLRIVAEFALNDKEGRLASEWVLPGKHWEHRHFVDTENGETNVGGSRTVFHQKSDGLCVDPEKITDTQNRLSRLAIDADLMDEAFSHRYEAEMTTDMSRIVHATKRIMSLRDFVHEVIPLKRMADDRKRDLFADITQGRSSDPVTDIVVRPLEREIKRLQPGLTRLRNPRAIGLPRPLLPLSGGYRFND